MFILYRTCQYNLFLKKVHFEFGLCSSANGWVSVQSQGMWLLNMIWTNVLILLDVPCDFEICLYWYLPVAHVHNCNPGSYQLSANTFTKNRMLLAGFLFSPNWSCAGEIQLTIKGLARLSGYLITSYSVMSFLSEFGQ